MTHIPVPCALVGAGRLGRALAAALPVLGIPVTGPHPRGFTGDGSPIVLLAVPDGAIAEAAALLEPGPLVGHCSGATGLDALAPHADRFSVHPLMTVPADAPVVFTGAGGAIAGSTPEALAVARGIADALGLHTVEVDDDDRAAYHAAAAIASNFLVTLEAAAERLLPADRDVLVPLVRATVENWAALGPERALTGPIARGDEETVARHREAVGERAPELLALFDVLAEQTRALARGAVAAR